MEWFRPECYEYYAKIWPGVTIDSQIYKLSSNKDISHITQSGIFLDFKEYRENLPFKQKNGNDFNFLNDNNKKTFLEFDTRERTDFFLELEQETVPWEFHFVMDIDSNDHDFELFISKDWEKFDPISIYNVEDFAFKFFKIEFRNQKNTAEIIKVRELSFKKRSTLYLVKSISKTHIEVFSNYICPEPEWETTIISQDDFSIHLDTPKLWVQLIKNPKLHIFNGVDTDNDWIDDTTDNCLWIYNPQQEDINGDGIGNACSDDDEDGIIWHYDNCPQLSNSDQTDVNQNRVGDVCEFDKDSDGIPDGIDNCITEKNAEQLDSDGDNIWDTCDNCKSYNPGQLDTNENSIGDVCETIEKTLLENDKDLDGIINFQDNCLHKKNPNQEDFDKDGIGDACDNCINIQNTDQWDFNENGMGDMCEDIDNDNFIGFQDNCPYVANGDQKDTDNDDIWDLCEDNDNDDITYLDDNCPHIYNPTQIDRDKDGQWDACDEMDDRFLETNKSFFIIILVFAGLILSSSIYSLFRKISKK